MCQVYFFHPPHYTRFTTLLQNRDPGFPKALSGDWTGLPADGADAALNWGNGKTYFFVGPSFYRFDNKAHRVDPGYPRAIMAHWPGLGLDRVDACINWGNGKAYFFRNDQFWRYDLAGDKTDSGYPKPIGAFWPGLPADGVHAAFNAGNGKAFFFRDGQCWQYDIKADRVDPGFPRPLADCWPGLPEAGVRAPVVLTYAGIDRLGYPGDATMRALWETTNLTWTGFYLAPAPSQPHTGWMNRLAFLRALGWGVAPIYVGQQQDGPGSHVLTAAQGALDAADAVGLADRAGFAPGAVLYLDIETGGPIQAPLRQYYLAWVQGVVDLGYTPGVYCSYKLAGQLRQLDGRPRFWVFRIGKTPAASAREAFAHPFAAQEPIGSSVPFATVWQHTQNIDLVLPDGKRLEIYDLDTCSARDPSA